MDISSYVSQHREALMLAKQLQGKLMDKRSSSVAEITKILIELAGKLKFHLAMEDKFVYPNAVVASNAELRDTARKMQAQMLGVTEAFGKYIEAWNSNAIAKDINKFASETTAILGALQKRIDIEEKTFYPLVHKHL